MLTITDLNGNSELLTDYKSLTRKRRVNGEYSLTFILFKTERNEHSYPLVTEESILGYDGQQYRIKKTNERQIGNTVTKTVTAQHIFFDLIDQYQYTTTTGYLSIIESLDIALGGTDYTYQVIDVFNQYQIENFGDDNCLSLIQKILDRYGAEVEIDNKHLVFRQQIGSKTDFQFRFKYNTRTIQKSVDTSSLCTYIRGTGADGISAEYTSPNYVKYGYRHQKPVVDERYTTVEGLLARLQKEIQDEPIISFTLEFVDLQKAGYQYESIGLGDEIFVIYEPLEIDITARILEITEYPEELRSSQVTLANFKNSATDIMTSFSQTQKKVDGILDGKEKLPFNALDAEVQRMTNILKNSESEIEWASDGSLIFRDKTNPNEIVIINSKGLGISDNNLVDVLSAITGKGIVADVITSGELNANNVNITNLKIGANMQFDEGYDPSTKTTFAEAQSAAEAVAKAEAELAQTNAEAYADGIVSAEEQARINDAQAKLTEAKTYASTVASTAETNAKNASVPKGVKFDNSVVIGNGNGIKVKDASNNDRVILGQYAAGKYGLKVNNGEIYSTTIQTGAEGATTYIKLDPNGDFEAVRNGKRIIFMQASATEGRLTLFNGSGNDTLALNAVYGLDSAYYSAVRSTSNADGLYLDSGGSSLKVIRTGGINVSLNGYSNEFYVAGNIYAYGQLRAYGSKPAIVDTDSFGQRFFYAIESTEVRFSDQGLSSTENGEVRISLDPIFIEAIETHSEETPWLIRLNKYDDVDLYISEIGNDYFVVKERNGKSGKFTWELSAIRKNYKNVRLDQYDEVDDVLTSNWEDELVV
ncbi:phage tail protein [Schinkia azotoformans]|uniref:phage tail protein n=1 Tax=Schinkia azotoformans TaxID=1454 RepID=UPI002DBCF936|nr:phage tail protein [Schinkia azotoformans]MEC1778393.1 phage tail protein [Schinkia azotoformans]MED4328362.1 phage tail protein [Schinkia azotoformans]